MEVILGFCDHEICKTHLEVQLEVILGFVIMKFAKPTLKSNWEVILGFCDHEICKTHCEVQLEVILGFCDHEISKTHLEVQLDSILCKTLKSQNS